MTPDPFPLPLLPVTPAPPYSWAQTVSALVGFGAVPDRGRPVAADGTPVDPATAGLLTGWELALQLDGPEPKRVSVRLEPAAGEGPFAPDIKLHITGGLDLDGRALAGHDLTLGEAQSVWDQLDQFLALSLEVEPLVEEARNDPAFQPVAAALYGFHPPRFRSAFQAACWTVVRQRTPQKFAVATMERLTHLLGTEVVGASGPGLKLFPPPGRLAHGERDALIAATNNLRKVERLEGLAAEFATVSEAELLAADYDEVLKWLKSLPGLGPWSAEQVIWRGFGRVERAPWRDTGALGAVSAVYTPGLTLVKGAARELARHYGELQGVWLSYLKAYPRVAESVRRPSPAPSA